MLTRDDVDVSHLPRHALVLMHVKILREALQRTNDLKEACQAATKFRKWLQKNSKLKPLNRNFRKQYARHQRVTIQIPRHFPGWPSGALDALHDLLIHSVQLEITQEPGFKEEAFEESGKFLRRSGAISVEGRREPAADICSLGDKRYRVGAEQPVVLTETEDRVLQTFLEYPAMDKPKLIQESGYGDAPRILSSISKKYSTFRPAIILPKRKGQGGYRVNIRPEG
jgi:hypothetical protein